MQNIRNLLDETLAAAFEAAGYPTDQARVEVSRRPELGQFQCNGALAAAKEHKSNPRAIGEAVLGALDAPDLIEAIDLAGPGFMNIRIAPTALAARADALLADERKGCPLTDDPKKTVMDYGGANVAKAMHVGHLRAGVIGDSLMRLFRFQGHDCTGDVHLGDWGTQMGMLIEAIKKEQPDLPYFDSGFTGPYPKESPVTIQDLDRLYPEASALCKSNEDEAAKARKALNEMHEGRPGYRALWQHIWDVSVAQLRYDYGRLGVAFDLWYGESTAHDAIPGMVEELKGKGIVEESDGALVIHVAKEEDGYDMPPMLLLKSDGSALYATTDLATLKDRVDTMKAEQVLYVVDRRQGMHFEQVFRAAEQAGYLENTSVEHIGYGTVNGEDGKPFKTRAGGTMKLGDLTQMALDEANARLDEAGLAQECSAEERAAIAESVAIAAIRFADLSHDPGSDYVFSLEKFTRFEGKTGPYLVYAAVRANALLAKAKEEKGLEPGPVLPPEEASEQELTLRHDSMGLALSRAERDRSPHHIADFAYTLSQDFNSFYQNCHILSMNDAARQQSRLSLVQTTRDQLVLALSLLGITVPERM